jgi:hypothetical protein
MPDFTFTRRDAGPPDWGAVPGEPEGVNTGIKILSQHPSLSNIVRHADAAIASVIARGSSPAVEWTH